MKTVQGILKSGRGWSGALPERWNGVLLAYAPGFSAGGVKLAPDKETAALLVEQGYALCSAAGAGGWAVRELLQDLPLLPSAFGDTVGHPEVSLVWGSSMGGQAAAAEAEAPGSPFDGALTLCGSVAGAVSMLNQALDGAFVALALLSEGNPALRFDPEDDHAFLALGKELVSRSLATEAGRARLSLACAVSQMPEWSQCEQEQAPRAAMRKLEQQAAVLAVGCFTPRKDLFQRVGGQFSWNEGVDYAAQLTASGLEESVAGHYRAGGSTLSLEGDLAFLSGLPRVEADPKAVDALHSQVTPQGALRMPVLTLDLIGDYAPVVSQSALYKVRAEAAGSGAYLRQTYLARPGHCLESAPERLSLIRALDARVRSGAWRQLALTSTMNAATVDGPDGARFAAFEPPRFLRPELLPATSQQLSENEES